jgi:putative transposase
MPKPPFLLTTAQMRRLSPHFPRSRGIPRVDDRRVLSGIIYVIRHGLQWRDAHRLPTARTRRSTTASSAGVFDRIFAALAAEGGPPSRLMLDATHLKAHRTAASLLKKGLFPAASAAPRAG